MTESRKVLAVVEREDVYERLAPILSRSTLRVNRVTNAKSSLILVANVHYDLIIVQHPLPGLEIDELLAALRAETAACAGSPLLLLAEEGAVEEVLSRVEHPQVQLLSLAVPAQQMQKAISEVLGVASRTASRLLVQLEVRLESGTVRRACQTKNLSESGLLLHTSHQLPVGSEVELSLSLPEDPLPVVARARIARLTDPSTEDLPGMGLEFLHLEEDSRERLDEFMKRTDLAAEPSELSALAIS